MRAIADRDVCEGHGICESIAPEVFQVDDDGEVSVLAQNPPESEANAVRLAVDSCPVAALLIED
jgi:ferredoxin